MTDVDEHNAALEKVTDFVEEKELNEDETKQLSTALSSLADPARDLLRTGEDGRAESSVKIATADVDVIVGELEVTKEEAHAALRSESGDLVQALRHLLR